MINSVEFEKLNSGGFAKVYIDKGGQCIYKINKKGIDKNDSIMALKNEISIYKYLEEKNACCDNIVEYFEYSDTSKYIILKLQRCDTDLSNFMKYAPISIRCIKQIIILTLKGFESLHNNGVIHCDFKPSNLLLKFNELGNFKIYICDFGLSEIGESKINNIKGTDMFIDPELIWSGIVQKKNDLWSLGILILFMLAPYANLEEKSFDFLKVSSIKQLKKSEPESHLSLMQSKVQTLISEIYDYLKNDFLNKLLTNILQVDSKQRKTANDLLDWISETHDITIQYVLEQNSDKEENPETYAFNLKSIPFITYLKINDDYRIFEINKEQIEFDNLVNTNSNIHDESINLQSVIGERSDENIQEAYRFVSMDIQNNELFYNDSQFLKFNLDNIKQYLTENEFNNEFKTKEFGIWIIKKIIELDDVFVGTISLYHEQENECEEEFTFVLKYKKAQLYMIEEDIVEKKSNNLLYINKKNFYAVVPVKFAKKQSLENILTTIEEYNNIFNNIEKDDKNKPNQSI